MSTLILLVGKSGSGKDYFIKKLGLKSVVSYTTRDMRPGEIDGREHKFVTNKEYYVEVFRHTVFIAYTYYNHNHYWITEGDLRGKDVYIVDVEGVKMFKNVIKEYDIFRNYIVIYFNVGLIRRIFNKLKRGDSWKNILSRIWEDFWAFRGIKKLKDYEIKY